MRKWLIALAMLIAVLAQTQTFQVEQAGITKVIQPDSLSGQH